MIKKMTFYLDPDVLKSEIRIRSTSYTLVDKKIA